MTTACLRATGIKLPSGFWKFGISQQAPMTGRLTVRDAEGRALEVEPSQIVALAAADTGAMVVSVRLPAERALAEAGRALPVDFVVEVTLPDHRVREVRGHSTFLVPR